MQYIGRNEIPGMRKQASQRIPLRNGVGTRIMVTYIAQDCEKKIIDKLEKLEMDTVAMQRPASRVGKQSSKDQTREKCWK